MGVFKQFATNRNLEEKGLHVEFNPNPDGTVPTLVVRRIYPDSPSWQAALERASRPHKAAMEAKTLSDADDERIMQLVGAECAVITWHNWRMPEGVAGGKGEGLSVAQAQQGYDLREDGLKAFQATNGELYDIPFSTEAVAEVFRVLPDLWRRIVPMAGDATNFRRGDLEAIAKNS